MVRICAMVQVRLPVVTRKGQFMYAPLMERVMRVRTVVQCVMRTGNSQTYTRTTRSGCPVSLRVNLVTVVDVGMDPPLSRTAWVDVSAPGVGHVNGAGQARIERVNGAQDLQRFVGIGDGSLHQRHFVCTTLPFDVARAGVPGGGNHCLVVLDFAVFDLDPVAQRPARRFVEAETLSGL